MKPSLVFFAAILLVTQVYAQTLFSYGPHKVSSAEFMRAFRKNGDPSQSGEKELRNYLDLYTAFKLKVQSAYDLGLDTMISKQEDVDNFKKQIEEQFLYDTAVRRQLIEQTKKHAARDLKVSHIFIPFKDEFISNPFNELPITVEDSIQARKKITEAYNRLRNKEDFAAVARSYSKDPNVKTSGGDLGYISVFTLPYNLEEIVYALPKDSISKPYASAQGYHIFKVTGERPAFGKLQVAQILIAIDQEGGESARAAAWKKADSLYQAVTKGADFHALARDFTYDQLSANDGGNLPAFSAGTYDRVFEEKAFSIKKDGDVMPPFETSLGIHIIKRIKVIPFTAESFAGVPWDEAVRQSERGDIAAVKFRENTPRLTGVNNKVRDLKEFRRYCDGALDQKPVFTPGFDDKSVLLEFRNEKVMMKEWIQFLSKSNYKRTPESFAAVWNNFVNEKCLAYYKAHLENYDKEYAAQAKEFMEGNMLFEAMELNVWSKASSDTTLQRKVYEKNRSKYIWGKSVDGIIFTTSDSSSAVALRKEILADPRIWRARMESSGGQIMADSSRLEWELVVPQNQNPAERSATNVVVNPTDGSASFVYIQRIYKAGQAKTFDEAKGQVITDCQQILEAEWINALKAKYPIKVEQQEWQKLVSQVRR